MVGYNRVNPFSPLENPGNGRPQPTAPYNGGVPQQGGYFQSPEVYSQPFQPYHGDLGSPEYEMHQPPRPGVQSKQRSQQSMNSEYSTSSTIFPSKPSPGTIETQSFLSDPMHRMDTSFNAKDVPYKDPHARQFRMILLGMSTRWFVTAGLCAAFVVSTIQWKKKGAQSESQKKLFNAVTTGISICLGLNIASAFKDIALNMRWVILAQKKRSLREVDLILSIDSMLRVAKLVFISGKPWVILAGSAWLFINILAQAGIAMISLTYGWEVAKEGVLMNSGDVTIPLMDHYYPQGKTAAEANTIMNQDEAYTAHLYGGLIGNYGTNKSEERPKPGTMIQMSGGMVYRSPKEKKSTLPFIDSPPGVSTAYSEYSIITEREISATYSCSSHVVTAGGNGTANNITVEGLGEIFVSHKAPNSTTFFTEKDGSVRNVCDDTLRCSVVQAFEASPEKAWYYTCNITVAKTEHDRLNISWISDNMASIAGSSIAQVGYTDDGQEAQIYPQGSIWGSPQEGNSDNIGELVSIYALGSLASATIFNPVTTYPGSAPQQGTSLQIGHRISFLMILGLICGCHLLFVVVVAILANKAKIGPDTHLEMGLLLRPIADQLEGVRSNGKANDAYYKVLVTSKAKYERSVNDRWILKTS